VDQVLYKKDPFMASSPAYLAATQIGLMLNRQTDVVVLNSASIETAYQIVTTGKVIFEADHDCRIEYEIVLKGLYFDFKPFLDKLRQHAILRISEKKAEYEVHRKKNLNNRRKNHKAEKIVWRIEIT
jgi:hypothetical protein